MKIRSLVSAVLIASLGASSLSFAQGWNRDHRDGRAERFERNDTRVMGDRGDRGDHGDRGDRGNRGDWREHGSQDRYYYGARDPEWHRGGYLPREYRNRQYVVDDWRAHHLAPPPRGYQWVQVGNDYVLAAIATGLIASLILSNQY